VASTYLAAGSARPHTPTTVGSISYIYDTNSNLASGNRRNYNWNAENPPLSSGWQRSRIPKVQPLAVRLCAGNASSMVYSQAHG